MNVDAYFNSQILEIGISVFNAICLLFCFTKMGITPWSAIIPIYGSYCLWDRVFGNGLICTIIGYGSIFLIFVSPIFALVLPILTIATYWKLFAGFGKGVVFRIFGLVFTGIALAICAFDDSNYCG